MAKRLDLKDVNIYYGAFHALPMCRCRFCRAM